MALYKQNNSFEVFGLEELQNMFKQKYGKNFGGKTQNH